MGSGPAPAAPGAGDPPASCTPCGPSCVTRRAPPRRPSHPSSSTRRPLGQRRPPPRRRRTAAAARVRGPALPLPPEGGRPHLRAVPRLTGRVKAGTAAIEYDELGIGRAEHLHARMLAALMADTPAFGSGGQPATVAGGQPPDDRLPRWPRSWSADQPGATFWRLAELLLPAGEAFLSGAADRVGDGEHPPESAVRGSASGVRAAAAPPHAPLHV
ncbi:iron-containing redox enzyme family protein [Streptomyces erythrochromogenes]|uniref:iron-containing redox enzyme family protein n=1 Tax=Streptomyces erythrochromogenes TaxID=285574 RepID=UPI0030B8D9E5